MDALLRSRTATLVVVEDGSVTYRWQITGWITGGVALVGLGVWGAVANLDATNKIASVVGAVVGVAGLVLSGYGISLARCSGPGPRRQSSVGGGGASGDVYQQVQAGRDAYTAGRDQHFGTGGPSSR